MGLNTDSLLKYFLCYTVTGLKSWVVFSPFEISTLNCRNFALLARLPKRPINHNFCSQMWLIEQLHIKLGFLPYLWRCLHSLQTLQAYVEGFVLFRTQLILKRKNSPWKLKSIGDRNFLIGMQTQINYLAFPSLSLTLSSFFTETSRVRSRTQLNLLQSIK